MKGYKGFNQDMTCLDFQYKEGETYTTSKPVILCQNGFHFCKQLTNCFRFYDKFDSRFFEIEADGRIVTDGVKSACSRITIGKELSRMEINRAIYGYGDGYSYGNGYGYGYGYGDGYGYGYSYGYGDGDGYGGGYGYGNGNGNGNGYGNGGGNGSDIQNILIFK